MKSNKRVLFVFMLALVGICAVSAQTKKEKEAQLKKELKEIIDSKDFMIDANMALPQSGRSVNLTSRYNLRVKNDSVFSYLPYYGRAYSVPYGGGQGLIFDAPIKEYKVDYNKKGAAKINLSARTTEDTYEYTLTIYPNGSSSISVNMNNRQSIDFTGELNKDEKEKGK